MTLGVSAPAYYQRATGQRCARASLTSGCSNGSSRCALRMALSRRRAGTDVQLVHHSDAG